MVETVDLGEGRKKISITVGEYSFSVLTQGAILNRFTLDGKNAILGFDDYRAYIHAPSYMGEVVGPFANRIRNASYFMDGDVHTLDRNDGGNSLHSGSRNYGDEVFEIAGLSDDSVTLALLSKERAGFPGNHEVMVTYLLSSDGVLTIDYQVRSDKRCPVNVTNHAYFNLNGGGDVREHLIRIDAEQYIRVDDELIPASIDKVEGTDFDFLSPHRIGERRGGAYDHCFCLGLEGEVVAEAGDRRLTMKTTMPGVQLYTGEFLSSDYEAYDGIPVGPFMGFCLESEYYPDFVNHPEYKGCYLEPGLTWRSTTSYKLERV